MEEPGHIYILINPSMDGLVKIGKTTRLPDERARELSQATGVATPFYVAYSIPVADCHHAEEFVHAILDHNGFRRSPNREFFQIPLQKAIEVLMTTQRHLDAEGRSGAVEADDSTAQTEKDSSFKAEAHPGRIFFEQGVAAYYGLGEAIQDRKEALELLQQSMKLGFPAAFSALAWYYRYDASSEDGLDSESGLQTALDILREGVRCGHGRCFIGMADLYNEKRQPENTIKCWKKYFQSQTFANDDDEKWTGGDDPVSELAPFDSGRPRLFAAMDFFEWLTSHSLQLDEELRGLLSPLKEEIIRGFQSCNEIYKQRAHTDRYFVEKLPVSENALRWVEMFL